MTYETTNITRRAFVGAAGAAALALAGCSGESNIGTSGNTTTDEATTAEGTVTGTFDRFVQGFDYGAGVSHITLMLTTPIDGAKPEDFTVVEHKQATDWSAEDYPVVEVDAPRKVTNVIAEGDIVDIDLACDPDNGSPFLYSMATGFNTWSDPYELRISLADGAKITSSDEPVTEFSIDPVPMETRTSADAWDLDSYECSDGTVYPYAAYSPAAESKNLVVWLHGAGEGGTEDTDPRVILLANKVVALSKEEFQTIVGSAHIVAPQCPTFWMDIGGSTYLSAETAEEATSIYSESLEEFIDAYAKEVGATKIVLAGCSNGGFMTLWLAIRRPDKYAGAVPICEAMPDSLVTDEQLAGLVNLPMYFLYAQNDETVIPELCEIPTINRLTYVGKSAETLHVATKPNVVDTTGTYTDTDEDGNQIPHEYNGHWSWIYFHNNDCWCDADELRPWDFIKGCFK